MEENKRQLCVHKLLSDAGEAWKWWDYAAGFAADCTMANGRFADRSCIAAQLDKAGLEQGAVDTCLGDSTADSTHDLLQVLSSPLPAGLSHVACEFRPCCARRPAQLSTGTMFLGPLMVSSKDQAITELA